MKVTQFYNEEYLQSANYQSFRTIASYIDGLKNGARKIIYTVDKYNITSDLKVSQLGSKVAEETEYLHGEVSLYSTIVGLAQNYPGSNNINLLQPEGNFGTRFIPEASAGRYIYTKKTKIFDTIFNKDDKQILIPQQFEGETIEPKFFTPIIPLILINGSEGIGNGFAQKILQRDHKEIIAIIENYLKGKKIPNQIVPSVKGYKGSIKLKDGKVEIIGKIDVVNSNTLKISEIPFTYNLQSYKNVLVDLEDKKIIKSFDDKSENDNYEFYIDCTREFTKTPMDELLDIFKLVKKVTENFTCIDENNAIVEFKDEKELLTAYIKIRLEYYIKRKKALLASLDDEASLYSNKISFIESVVNGTIVVNNKSKTDIEKQISKVKIKKIEGSYDYLLRMPIYSLTKEKIEELKKQLSETQTKINELKDKTEKDLWTADLENLKKAL